MPREPWLLSVPNPCCPTGQDIYSTIKKSQQNGKIPRFRRVRGGGELYTSDTVMQSEWGHSWQGDPSWALPPHSWQGAGETPELLGADWVPSVPSRSCLLPPAPVTASLLSQPSTEITSLSSGDGEMRLAGKSVPPAGWKEIGLCKMPGSCPMALGNFQCGQGLWANPSQAQTWGRNRVGTQEKDPAPLPWGCGGFQGKKMGDYWAKKRN